MQPSNLSRRLERCLVITVFACSLAQPSLAQTFSVIHGFTGPEGTAPVGGLTIDAAGNLYGTTAGGGFSGSNCPGNGCGTVFKMSHGRSDWVLSTLYQFHGGDGMDPVAKLTFGPDGAIYGSTGFGGRYSSGTVFKLQPPASFCHAIQCPWTHTLLYEFDLSTGGNVSGPVTFDPAGRIYGTTMTGGNLQDCSGGLGCGTVYQLVKSGGTWTQNVLYAFSGPDGEYPNSGVVFDAAGNIYGAAAQQTTGQETGNIFELSPSGSGWDFTIIAHFNSGTGVDPWAGLLQDQAGNLYGATKYLGSDNGGTVFELSPAGSGWNFNLLYNLPQGGSAGGPYAALIMDAAGNLYGTTERGGQYGYGSVFKLTPGNGGYTYTTLHDFTGNSGHDGAFPEGVLALGADGTLYGTASDGGQHGFQCGSGCGTVWQITP